MAGGPTVDVADERGETLIELLITMILLGTAVLGMLAGLITVARVSDHNSRATHVGSSAQSYAEQLKQPVDAATSTFTYVNCASTYPAFTGTLPGAGTYTASISSIAYLTALPSGAVGSTPTFGACPGTDLGLQRLTVKVLVDNGSAKVSETVTIIKRDARCNYSALYTNLDQGPC